MKIRFSQILPKMMYGNIDIWLFFCFLVLLPLSVRKVVWYLPLRGVFNEYADISLYASDVLLIAALGVWFFRKRHNILNLSSIQRCFTRNIKKISLVTCLIIILPLWLILWAAFSVSYSLEPLIGVFFVCKLLELYGLYLFTVFRIVPCETNSQSVSVLQKVIMIIVSLGVLEAILGVIQFFEQHSLGLTFIKESVINPALPGVAKVIINNVPYIRAYGTFPHPNILGGFLLVSIVLSHLYGRMFYVEQTQHKLVIRAILFIQYSGMIMTFSKSAIMGLGIALLYIGIVSHGTISFRRRLRTWCMVLRYFLLTTTQPLQRTLMRPDVGLGVFSRIRSFFQKKRLFHMEHSFLGWALGSVVIGICFIGLAHINRDALFFQSLREREIYQSIALSIIHNHPMLGISCGQLVIFMAQQGIYPLLEWQLQPVHNVLLLIWAELGVIGFTLFTVWFLLLLIPSYVKKQTRFEGMLSHASQSVSGMRAESVEVYLHAILAGFVLILLFDHYMWDIQQGQLVFWLISGILSGYILRHRNIN